MTRAFRCRLLVLLTNVLQAEVIYTQHSNIVTPAEFAQRFAPRDGVALGVNATHQLVLQPTEHLKLTAGLFSTSQARVQKGRTWLVRGVSNREMPKLDFTNVQSRSSPAILIESGSTLVLDTLQLVISELQSPRSTGQALGPAGLLGASTFGAAISVSAESTLVLADVDLVLPWAQFHSYFKSICQADGWAYTETLQMNASGIYISHMQSDRMHWERVRIKPAKSRNTKSTLNNTTLPCAAAVISNNASAGKDLHDALVQFIAHNAREIHVSLNASIVSLAPSACWAWSVVKLPESTRLRLYGRPAMPSNASIQGTGQALSHDATTSMQMPPIGNATTSHTHTSDSSLQHAGERSSTAISMQLSPEGSLASIVLDIAGIMQVLSVDSVLSFAAKRIVLKDLVLVNLPYAESPEHFHGLTQAMMNWVNSHRPTILLLGNKAIAPGMVLERCVVVTTQAEVRWWGEVVSKLWIKFATYHPGWLQVAKCSVLATAPFAACLHALMLSDRLQQVVLVNSYIVAVEQSAPVSPLGRQDYVDNSQSANASHQVSSRHLDNADLTYNGSNSATNGPAQGSADDATSSLTGPALWLPLLQPTLHNYWLPTLLFPDQHVVTVPALVGNFSVHSGPSWLLAISMQACGFEYMPEGISGLFLTQDALFLQVLGRSQAPSHAVGNCTLSGSAQLGLVVPQAIAGSMDDMDARLDASVPQPVLDTGQYGAIPRLIQDAVLRLQYIVLSNLSRGGSELKSVLYCQAGTHCNTPITHPEDALYDNMTMPLWWVGMARSPSSFGRNTSKAPQLLLRHVTLIIPCSELALWAVLMQDAGSPADFEESADNSSSSPGKAGAAGACLLARGSDRSLLLQRMRSFAFASELQPGQLLLTSTNHSGSSGNGSGGDGILGNSRRRSSFIRRMSFRRLVHWGWSGEWVTLTCDAPASVPQGMKEALQRQLDTAWEYGVHIATATYACVQHHTTPIVPTATPSSATALLPETNALHGSGSQNGSSNGSSPGLMSKQSMAPGRKDDLGALAPAPGVNASTLPAVQPGTLSAIQTSPSASALSAGGMSDEPALSSAAMVAMSIAMPVAVVAVLVALVCWVINQRNKSVVLLKCSLKEQSGKDADWSKSTLPYEETSANSSNVFSVDSSIITTESGGKMKGLVGLKPSVMDLGNSSLGEHDDTSSQLLRSSSAAEVAWVKGPDRMGERACAFLHNAGVNDSDFDSLPEEANVEKGAGARLATSAAEARCLALACASYPGSFGLLVAQHDRSRTGSSSGGSTKSMGAEQLEALPHAWQVLLQAKGLYADGTRTVGTASLDVVSGTDGTSHAVQSTSLTHSTLMQNRVPLAASDTASTQPAPEGVAYRQLPSWPYLPTGMGVLTQAIAQGSGGGLGHASALLPASCEAVCLRLAHGIDGTAPGGSTSGAGTASGVTTNLNSAFAVPGSMPAASSASPKAKHPSQLDSGMRAAVQMLQARIYASNALTMQGSDPWVKPNATPSPGGTDQWVNSGASTSDSAVDIATAPAIMRNGVQPMTPEVGGTVLDLHLNAVGPVPAERLHDVSLGMQDGPASMHYAAVGTASVECTASSPVPAPAHSVLHSVSATAPVAPHHATPSTQSADLEGTLGRAVGPKATACSTMRPAHSLAEIPSRALPRTAPSLSVSEVVRVEVQPIRAPVEFLGALLQVSSVRLPYGSQGDTYAGTWHSLPVAVKVCMLPAGMELDGTTPLHARARALREAALAVSLCHPHLLATLDVQLQPLTLVQQQGQHSQQGPTGQQQQQQGCMGGQQDLIRHVGPVAQGYNVHSRQSACVGAWRLCLVQEVCNLGSLACALHAGLLAAADAGAMGSVPSTVCDGNGMNLAAASTAAISIVSLAAPSLSEALSSNRARVRLAFELLAQVALGVSHLHARRIVHGDLCPANVLLTLLPPGEGLGNVHEELQYMQVPTSTQGATSVNGSSRDGCSSMHKQVAMMRKEDALGIWPEATAATIAAAGVGAAAAVAASNYTKDATYQHTRKLGALAHSRLWARVSDFGLSSCLGPHRSHASGARMCRLQYMCPTLLAQGHASMATDTFAFGVMAREVLQAATATAGSSCCSQGVTAAEISEVPSNHMNSMSSTSSNQERVHISPHLHALLDACMGDPSMRPSVQLVADALLHELTQVAS